MYLLHHLCGSARSESTSYVASYSAAATKSSSSSRFSAKPYACSSPTSQPSSTATAKSTTTPETSLCSSTPFKPAAGPAPPPSPPPPPPPSAPLPSAPPPSPPPDPPRGRPKGGFEVMAAEAWGRRRILPKRKELEEVYDEFSEFSLSSPARKIRRLDAELPPIMEEEEPAATLVFAQPLPKEQLQGSSKQFTSAELTNAEASPPLNDERAIVLYKPVNELLLDSPCPSNVFLSVDPDVIAGFKDQAFWRIRQNIVKSRDEEAETSSGNGQAAGTSCLAVVPWMPSRLSEPANAVSISVASDRLMEEEEIVHEGAEGSSMDMEVDQGQADGVATSGIEAATDGLQHWQQHCMTTQVGASESTPVMWSWG